jgi:hypothetical protein
MLFILGQKRGIPTIFLERYWGHHSDEMSCHLLTMAVCETSVSNQNVLHLNFFSPVVAVEGAHACVVGFTAHSFCKLSVSIRLSTRTKQHSEDRLKQH